MQHAQKTLKMHTNLLFDGNRPQERPICKWKDNIKMNSTHMDQNSDQRRTLLKTAMKLLIS
jgi:hypothetical protein